MIQFLTEQTSITQVSETEWVLQLVWNQSGVFGLANVKLHLDKSMRALPVEYVDAFSSSFSIGMPSISFSPSGVTVSPNRRVVTFSIHTFSLAMGGSDFRKEFKFEWLDPNTLPENIELLIQIKTSLRYQKPIKFFGRNASVGLVELIRHRRESAFIFPATNRVIQIPYAEFSVLSAKLQQLKETTVSAVTWPAEVHFWLTPAGTSYLAAQVAKIDQRSEESRPTRIAVNPFAAVTSDGSHPLSRLFLQEMMVHQRLGVRVLVVDPQEVERVAGSEKAFFALYGSALGLRYYQSAGAGLNEGNLSLFFSEQTISATMEQLDDLSNRAVPLIRFLHAQRIDFNALELEGIGKRIELIRTIASDMKGS